MEIEREKMRTFVRQGLQFVLLLLTFCVVVRANQGTSEVTGKVNLNNEQQ